MIRNNYRSRAALLVVLGICMLPQLKVRAQEAQVPLGDVVRKQQTEREHGKKAKRVIGDEDIRSSRLHEIYGDAAVSVIIPNVRIVGMVPDGASYYTRTDAQKMHVWFGPRDLDRCFDLICAEGTYMSLLPRMIGGPVKILFTSDDSIDGNPARIVHFEITHDVRGKIIGTVALIQTPVAAGAASCHYLATDAPAVERDCDAFIRSLKIRMPERYIYVQHNY